MFRPSILCVALVMIASGIPDTAWAEPTNPPASASGATATNGRPTAPSISAEPTATTGTASETPSAILTVSPTQAPVTTPSPRGTSTTRAATPDESPTAGSTDTSGAGPTSAAPSTAPTGSTRVAARSVTLATSGTGTLGSWGSNEEGALGNGTTTSSSVPVQVVALSAVAAISSGDDTGYALRSDGTVWAWGSDRLDRLVSGSHDRCSCCSGRVRGVRDRGTLRSSMRPAKRPSKRGSPIREQLKESCQAAISLGASDLCRPVEWEPCLDQTARSNTSDG
jgi:hypothetical protein